MGVFGGVFVAPLPALVMMMNGPLDCEETPEPEALGGQGAALLDAGAAPGSSEAVRFASRESCARAGEWNCGSAWSIVAVGWRSRSVGVDCWQILLLRMVRMIELVEVLGDKNTRPSRNADPCHNPELSRDSATRGAHQRRTQPR